MYKSTYYESICDSIISFYSDPVMTHTVRMFEIYYDNIDCIYSVLLIIFLIQNLTKNLKWQTGELN